MTERRKNPTVRVTERTEASLDPSGEFPKETVTPMGVPAEIVASIGDAEKDTGDTGERGDTPTGDAGDSGDMGETGETGDTGETPEETGDAPWFEHVGSKGAEQINSA